MQNPVRKWLLQGLTAAAIAAAGAAMPAQAKEKFIFAHAMNTDHVFHALSERFMSELEGNETIEIAYHPGGDLGDWTSLFEQSMQGVVPMTLTWAVPIRLGQTATICRVPPRAGI